MKTSVFDVGKHGFTMLAVNSQVLSTKNLTIQAKFLRGAASESENNWFCPGIPVPCRAAGSLRTRTTSAE